MPEDNRSPVPGPKPKIAVFSGASATIAANPPLVTSNKAREKYRLPPRSLPDGRVPPWDVVRPQRLARPVTVYIEQFSAHPLEHDAATLYAPPDGYLDAEGAFHASRQQPTDVPVYEVVLRPEDGLYALPYMARQADGRPWEDDASDDFAPPERCRQPFYPDASRIFEEIDRFAIGTDGMGNALASRACFDFYRAAPPGGYWQGLPAAGRTDVGMGDIPRESLGADFFPYKPFWLFQSPRRAVLARVTNIVQRALAGGAYAGAMWLEGSPNVEETLYWLSLLIDTGIPIVGNASQQPHGSVGNDGDQNLIDAVTYIVSGVWADENGRDRIGPVAVQNKQIFTARDVQKGDARPGGFVATGGHGGIVGRVGEDWPVTPTVLTFLPARRHTSGSMVNLQQLPATVRGVRRDGSRIITIDVHIIDGGGDLRADAIPKVTIVKEAYQYAGDAPDDTAGEVDILARLEHNLRLAPLAGFVGEGMAPYGVMSPDVDRALRRAVYSGLPVVKVGRGNADGFTPRTPPFVSGQNLTATKARLLLMASLMKLGSLPAAVNPDHPTTAESAATNAAVDAYQMIFDTH